MPVRVKRRIFAAPFVVTVAAAAACNTGDPQPPKNPETDPTATTAPTTTAVPTSAPTAAPTTEPTTPPVATATPSGAPVATGVPPTSVPPERWLVTKSGKTCEAKLDLDCPPAASCNPPPPQAYACPASITRFPATIERNRDTNECTTRVFSDNSGCPPNMHCNPPPPRNVKVPCP